MVNSLLEKVATVEKFAETESSITILTQPAGMNLLLYAEEFVAKTLRCGDVFEKYALNEVFTNGLDSSIRKRVREY